MRQSTFFDEELTPENKKWLADGKAMAETIWDRIHNDVSELNDFRAFACVYDLIVMHIGYFDGRWPGVAKEAITEILKLVDEEDDATEE